MPNGPIIIKKKGGHGGHHGGAWKVAYADFVTAMMALFIVLWLLNSSKEVKEAVGGYFKDPSGTSKLVGSSMSGSGNNIDVRKEDMKKLKEAIEKQIKQLPDFEKLKKHIDMTITNEGLRIELTEAESGTFFQSGNAQPSPSGKQLLVALADELGKMSNQISIEGHTDNKPYSGGMQGYSNWELSVDRGNAARRIMVGNGLKGEQVSQVRGFADQRPRAGVAPEDPANRRISVIVLYREKTKEEMEAEAKKEEEEEAKAAKEGHGKEGEHGKEGAKGEAHGESKGGEAHGEPAKGEAKPSAAEHKH